MGRLQKEGQKGSKANFITRTQAVKKLQGIYPREPSKSPKGKDKTYYFKKDILYLQHDPLLQKFRDHRVWKRKVKKAKDRKEWDKVKALKASKPTYNLTHLVKERFPTFVDALRDMDDALCTVALFAMMPATQKIAASRVSQCSNLMQHFRHYVSLTQSLHKVFVSIKGIYYQARLSPLTRISQSQNSSQNLEAKNNILLNNEVDETSLITVTWLEPFTFTQKVTKDVDYKVMLSFLEFYEVQLGFILYKLYTNIGLKYPPPKNSIITSLSENSQNLSQSNPPSNSSSSSTSSTKSSKQNSKGKEKEEIIKATSLFDDEDDDEDEEESIKSDGNSVKNSTKSTDEAQEEDDDMDTNDKEVFGTFGGIQERTIANKMANIFKPTLIWLSRETPVESLQFIIRCYGGKVAWEGGGVGEGGAPLNITENDERITHFVTDRGGAHLPSQYPNASGVSLREYVQPQYIYDCVNARVLLPTHEYAPGHPLPPHLSPFVVDVKEGYIPEYRKTLDSLFLEKYGVPPPSSSIDPKNLENLEKQNQLDAIENMPNEDDSESDETVYARELNHEQTQRKGKKSEGQPASAGGKKRKRPSEQDIEQEEQMDQKEVAAALLPKKKRRLLERIKYGQNMRENVIEKLQHKKEMIQQGKAAVSGDSTVVYAEAQNQAKDDDQDE